MFYLCQLYQVLTHYFVFHSFYTTTMPPHCWTTYLASSRGEGVRAPGPMRTTCWGSTRNWLWYLKRRWLKTVG